MFTLRSVVKQEGNTLRNVSNTHLILWVLPLFLVASQFLNITLLLRLISERF